MAKLGKERETTEKQLTYLTEVATNFQRLVSLAVEAKYGHDSIFDDDHLRLATLVTTRNATFASDISLGGHKYQFDPSANIRNAESNTIFGGEACVKDPTHGNQLVTRLWPDRPEIEELLQAQESIPIASQKPLDEWLGQIYKRSRGFELGSFDSSILATTMKMQSEKWTSIAMGYISDVVAIVHHFINTSLRS